MRLKDGQIRHDRGVLDAANELVRNRWAVVFADLPGTSKPPTIGNYIPDVFGQNGNEAIIIEIETEDSMITTHTQDQHRVFRQWEIGAPLRRFIVRVV
jgi:hypothetical protein